MEGGIDGDVSRIEGKVEILRIVEAILATSV
jgi:hypothetical protein